MYERARRISTGRVIKRASKFTGCTGLEIKTERVQGLISALGVRPKTRNSGARFFRDTLYADYFVKLIVPWRAGFAIPCRNTLPNSVTSNNPRAPWLVGQHHWQTTPSMELLPKRVSPVLPAWHSTSWSRRPLGFFDFSLVFSRANSH